MDEIEINGIRFTIAAEDDEPALEVPEEEIIATEEYGDLLVRPCD